MRGFNARQKVKNLKQQQQQQQQQQQKQFTQKTGAAAIGMAFGVVGAALGYFAMSLYQKSQNTA